MSLEKKPNFIQILFGNSRIELKNKAAIKIIKLNKKKII